MAEGKWKLVIATGNAHKLEEIRQILGEGVEVVGLREFPGIEPEEETATTFDGNARIKAESVSRQVAGLVLADDSGLEVDALKRQPGVRSARYAGEGASDADNRGKLMAALRGKGLSESTARFRCVMALARGGETIGSFEGAVEGVVRVEEAGKGGFGYDPLFVPIGYQRSFAELPAAIKNALSHRGKALQGVLDWLQANTNLQKSLLEWR
ncbi:MAG: RdgB/HAM1 family non-canonical purine NTP pyrophosphatase [Verrucomicrobiota bacterium]